MVHVLISGYKLNQLSVSADRVIFTPLLLLPLTLLANSISLYLEFAQIKFETVEFTES